MILFNYFLTANASMLADYFFPEIEIFSLKNKILTIVRALQ
jgi:hypothetical protein